VNEVFDIFPHLLWRGEWRVVFGRVYRRNGQTIPFFSVLKGQYQQWGGWFVPVVMAMKKGDTTGVLGLFQILVSYS
jgi:hypothetical protein